MYCIFIFIHISFHSFSVFFYFPACPGQVAQLIGVLSCTPEGCGFDSPLGHMSRFDPWSGRVWGAADWCFSLTSMVLSLSPFLSL